MDYELGIKVTVTGEASAFAFPNKDTGGEIGWLKLRVPGGTVGIGIDSDNAKKIKEGEIWEVVGFAGVFNGKDGAPARLNIHRPISFRKVKGLDVATSAPTFDFGGSTSGPPSVGHGRPVDPSSKK